MSTIDTVNFILERCGSERSSMPPTLLYNEGWMLRLLLEWFSQQPASGHPLSFPEGAQWYSEALIPSAFLPRKRGDKYAESWTHADGVIGHFEIGKNRDTDLTLLREATTLKVLEAKMLSKLSEGIKHAPYYNQAARNIACIAEILKRADKRPEEMLAVSFFLIAPSSQIKKGVADKLSSESIRSVVNRRIVEYDEDKNEWYEQWFLPTLHAMDIRAISWEDILSYIKENDPNVGGELCLFYEKCLEYNRFKMNAVH